MNVLLLIIPAFLLYGLAHRFYARRLGRVFGEDDTRPTPAETRNDGVDYVPTRPHVLCAHHFSAIAAAGPIVGPTMALLYGYMPAFVWIVVGAILIGAVHDYACMYVSVREGGCSIAEIAHKTMGRGAFVLFALFIIFNLVVVNAVFINLTAVSLTSLTPPAKIGLPDDQTIFRTIAGPKGEPQAVVGGIASTSAVALTVLAPLLGFLIVKRRMREVFSYPLATVICIGSVLVGFALPIAPPNVDFSLFGRDFHFGGVQVWIFLIALYVWLAAAVPVWLILQPREFVSVQFLYLGILLLVFSLIGAGLRGHSVQAPPMEVMQGELVLGSVWPILFVTIACGAVSGFHGLVGSGTTSKQVMRESHARHVGYGAMLGESALAMCVTLAIAVGISFPEYTSYLVKPIDAPAGWKANPILAFSAGVAGICELGLGIPRWLGLLFGLLMVEGFVLDTLDVAIRLNRYLLEEIWSVLFGWLRPKHFPTDAPARAAHVPRFLRNYWVNSGISVAMMLALAWGNTADTLWPIFGTGNQLLAALSLTSVGIWFFLRRRRSIYVLVPAVLVGATTVASLIYLLKYKYYPSGNVVLITTDIVFLTLALGILIFALRAVLKGRIGNAVDSESRS